MTDEPRDGEPIVSAPQPEAREGEDVVQDAPAVVDPPKEPAPVDVSLEPHEQAGDPSIVEKRGEAARRRAQNG